MSVSFALVCEPCKQGRHGDCICTVECSCYSYGEAHMGLEPHHGPGCVARMYADAGIDLEHDLEKDLGDGGLGSGKWLEEEL